MKAFFLTFVVCWLLTGAYHLLQYLRKRARIKKLDRLHPLNAGSFTPENFSNEELTHAVRQIISGFWLRITDEHLEILHRAIVARETELSAQHEESFHRADGRDGRYYINALIDIKQVRYSLEDYMKGEL